MPTINLSFAFFQLSNKCFTFHKVSLSVRVKVQSLAIPTGRKTLLNERTNNQSEFLSIENLERERKVFQ